MKTFVWLAVGLLVAIFLVAVGSATIDRLKEIQVYRKAIYALPEKFEPINALSTADSAISNLIYDGLFSVDENLKIVPTLVSTWDVSSDGRTYKLHLVEKHFHDGKVLDTDDVVWSLGRLIADGSPVKETFKRMKQVKRLDSMTVQIELDEPHPQFIALLAAPTAKISRSSSTSPYHLGTGDFAFKEIATKNNHRVLTLARVNDGPKIKTIELWEVTEAEAIEMVKNSFLHDSSIYTSKRIPNVTEISTVTETRAPAAITWVIGLNTQNTLLKDQGLRKCLNAGFDKSALVKQFIPDQSVASGLLPPTLAGAETLEPHTVDLAECGRKYKGTELTLSYPAELDNGAAMCQFLQNSYAKIDLRLKCAQTPFSNLLDGIIAKTSEMSLLAMTLDLPDVEYFLNTFESTAKFNLSSYSSKNIDKKLFQARLEKDRLKRAEYFRDINREIFDNDITINLSYPKHISYRNSCLSNFRIGLAGDGYINYSAVTLNPLCTHRGDFL